MAPAHIGTLPVKSASERPSREACLGDLIGACPAIQKVYALINRASQFHFPVLVLGESGTGKELVARAIHSQGQRRSRPFVPVDCAALVPTLIESELFGYVKGAFTGADHPRIGLLEAANGGTVFLDEIGEMPLHCQTKLLRALQEHEIRPVGASDRLHIDVRVIAATNRSLESEVKSGRFRQDLFFRLNVLQIAVLALRERKSDIPLLVDSFLSKYGDLQPSIRSVSEDGMRCLMSYNWPGNVRELEHAIEHALALGEGPAIEIDDLPSAVQSFQQASLPSANETFCLEEVQRRAIFQALSKTHGDKLAAAQLLHIGKTTLYRKLKEYSANAECA
jgi:two-component system response regulator AtoC